MSPADERQVSGGTEIDVHIEMVVKNDSAACGHTTTDEPENRIADICRKKKSDLTNGA